MSNKTFSLVKGYAFRFEDEGRVIEAWFSALSGREKVFVNGEMVLSQTNLSKQSSKTFRIGENDYSITLYIESLLNGPVVCTLAKNGKDCQRQRLIFPQRKSRLGRFGVALNLLFFIVLGIVAGFATAYWQLPAHWSYVAVGLLVAAVVIYQINNIRHLEPVIENETGRS
ncbi:hypothetical protein [Marinimicrobium sp. ARAG 43.8]|uniref:hypothetical protein n=1 Tax=Marinimicrobium sp. ARAG 43.8 TaxID=3418719 RepID=UPI003CEF9CFD